MGKSIAIVRAPKAPPIHRGDGWSLVLDEDAVTNVRVLLQSGIIHIDERDRIYGQTLLHSAFEHGHMPLVEALLDANADTNAANTFGRAPLHYACSKQRFESVRVLVAAGADVHVKDSNGREPLHACLESTYPIFSVDKLRTLQLLVAAGAKWDVTADKLIASGRVCREAGALRLCVKLWMLEQADGLPFSDITPESVERGAASTQAYIENLMISRETLLRRKICVVGGSGAGKTSLIKSITSSQPQLVHIDDRTIGIDQFPYRFSQRVMSRDETTTHEITFWDFAGQDAYQVAHALFFSPRTMFLVCVDLDAFTLAFLQASVMATVRKQEVQLMDEFIERTVMQWIRLILARQPDAEFKFIATKEDLLRENHVTERLLKQSLISKLEEVGTRVEEMTNRHVEETRSSKISIAFGPSTHITGHYQPVDDPVVFVSCTSPESVNSARTRIEAFIVQSDRSFQMPDVYTRVLDAIVEMRESSRKSDISSRIQRVFAPVESLPEALGIDPTLCRTVLQILHDLGDVLWYEDLGVELMRNTVLLDPLLLLDFIRVVISHRNTGVTMSHANLKALPFWIGLTSPAQMKAFKQLLQEFHLVYPADDSRVMEWDSDLIVPAFWQTNTPAAWLFLGDILRLDKTSHTHEVEVVRCHWEYHFEFGLPSSLFDHLVVATVSAYFQFEAGPDWIVYEDREKATAAWRAMVGRDQESLHRTIHIEAVVSERASEAQAAMLWSSFRHLCSALVGVLRGYPGLVVSSFAWDDEENKISLKRLVRSSAAPPTVRWLPPTETWECCRRIMGEQDEEGAEDASVPCC